MLQTVSGVHQYPDMAGLFNKRDSKKRDSKKCFTPLPRLSQNNPQIQATLYDKLAASTSYVPQEYGHLQEGEQGYITPKEGDKQTFEHDSIEMNLELPHQSINTAGIQTHQSVPKNDPIHAVIQTAVQAAMNYQAENQ